MTRQIEITALSGVSAGDIFRFDLQDGESITLGRAEDCDIMLQDPLVSRRHASVTLKGGEFILSDLGSTHGTTHMGFTLSIGDDDARPLRPGDEFKLGQSLFRALFEESQQPNPVATGSFGPPPVVQKTNALDLKQTMRRPAVRWGAVVLGLLLLVFLMLPENKQSLPPQRSSVVMNLPQYRVLGNVRVGKGAKEGDRSHIDQVQFWLPSADQIVELEYLAEGPLTARLDEIEIASMPASTQSWRRQVFLFRDILGGSERRFAIDNPDFPRKSGSSGPLKKWGVRDVRSTPVVIERNDAVLSTLKVARINVEKIGQTPMSHFRAMRSLQEAALAVLNEGRIDFAHYEINPEAAPAESLRYSQIVDDLIRQRELGTISSQSLLDTTLSLISDLDAELWRRTELAINVAERAAKLKQHIVGYDALVNIQSIIPEGEDRRWDIVAAVLSNKKIVPTKVLKSPAKFRKKEMDRK